MGSCTPNWGTQGRPRFREQPSGTLIPLALVRPRPDPVGFGLAPTPWSEILTRTHNGSIEAAHVLSTHLTEPMRFCRSSPTPCAALDAAKSRLLWHRHLRGRARRFAWPTRGTERFLGREPWPFLAALQGMKERRRSAGTRSGLTPYSCLVPPRLTTLCQSSDETPKPNHPGAVRVDWIGRVPFGRIG